MRDFLYSEIANFHGIPNIPAKPDIAIEVGKRLCEELLEPLSATFGRIAIRSAYRSRKVNDFGNKHKYSCGSSEANRAGHIWDEVDVADKKGATACIVVPWFADRYEKGADWRKLAYWVHDHLPYASLEFYPKLAAFNISWHEHPPERFIYSYVEPLGYLAIDKVGNKPYSKWYKDFPRFRSKP